ncbi:MAG: C25 family cysteine peptidase, partial [Verrucomicrobiota bacterium]|nr:C25 family cysteine peptidase [Verrucomicrobiota bacterium]
MQKKTYILLSIILIVSSAFLLVNRSEVKRDLSNIKAKRSTFQSKKISNATLRKTSHSAIKKEDQQKTAFTKNSQEKKDTKTEEKSLEPIKILYSDQNKTVMAFSLPEFSIEETTFSERKVSIIKAAKNGVLKAKNKPALPVYRTNIIIPENSEVSVSYSDTSFDEIPIKQPIPSAGFISRTQPKTTPTFSNIYDNPLPYPEKSVRVTKNYKIRSIQAVGIIVQPFQYYPQKKILKIYKNLIITVNTTHATDEKPLLTKIPTGEFAESAKIYFANYEQATRGQEDTDETGGRGGERGSATPLPENNKLLVIVPDNVNFADSSIDEFIEWKRERGLTVEKVLYPTDTGGSGSTALEAYLQNKYDTENIAFVIFIGDYEDIPVIDSTDNPSDTLYTRVSGTDYYHDFLISRISAQNNEEVANQLTKIINYEKSPQGSGWLTKALFVASNEGASQSSFDKDDWEILEEEWDDTQDDTGLSEYGYTEIRKLYDSHYPYPDDSGSP